MKELRYTQPFVNMLTKQEVKDGDTVLTLQHLLFNVATSAEPGEVLPIDEKMRLHSIAQKIVNMKPLKAADMETLKKRSVKYLSILAFGFVVQEISLALEETPEETE